VCQSQGPDLITHDRHRAGSLPLRSFATGNSPKIYSPRLNLTTLQIPAKENAPILIPEKAGRSSPWPLVLFSHGLAGGKTTYR
jgi:Platelet-activating factor acetylhydrolase, isoform II